jgi:dihydroorotate dehydrogenase
MASLLARLARPIDPETAHELAIAGLAAWGRIGAPLGRAPAGSPRLATRVVGLDFPNPLGLAAGLDKNGAAVTGLFALGFGAVEIGTLTPLPQPGNPRPRLFRLAEDAAVINRYGFNNVGLDHGLAGLPRRPRPGPLGINVGANKDVADRIADYRTGVTRAAVLADYITINISSPNTPGLRDLQHGAALRELLAACAKATGSTPLFLKVAPDLTPAQVDDVARAAMDARIAALVIGNTTVSRPALRSGAAQEAGGLSGVPLAPLARQRLADFRAATGGRLPLVAAGGIDSGAEAYARIRAGASLVQLYSALAFHGPGLPGRILRDLDRLLARDGFTSVTDAVGAS